LSSIHIFTTGHFARAPRRASLADGLRAWPPTAVRDSRGRYATRSTGGRKVVDQTGQILPTEYVVHLVNMPADPWKTVGHQYVEARIGRDYLGQRQEVIQGDQPGKVSALLLVDKTIDVWPWEQIDQDESEDSGGDDQSEDMGDDLGDDDVIVDEV